jgi:hypothetical protein
VNPQPSPDHPLRHFRERKALTPNPARRHSAVCRIRCVSLTFRVGQGRFQELVTIHLMRSSISSTRRSAARARDPANNFGTTCTFAGPPGHFFRSVNLRKPRARLKASVGRRLSPIPPSCSRRPTGPNSCGHHLDQLLAGQLAIDLVEAEAVAVWETPRHPPFGGTVDQHVGAVAEGPRVTAR